MFDVQPDKDQDDPDERHDPDSDTEVDDNKAVEASARSPSLPLRSVP
jgi:histone deacetylase 1/2